MTDKYSQMARTHWQKTDPERHQAIEDPETFVRELGEQAQTQVQERPRGRGRVVSVA